MPNLFKILPILLIVFTFIPHDTYAKDLALSSKGTSGSMKTMEKFIAGTMDSDLSPELIERVRRLSCKDTIPSIIHVETGKVLYRDMFHQIESDEQVKEIEILREKVQGTDDCIEKMRLIVDYDKKWYREKREKDIKAREDLWKFWASQVKDTGAENYDIVMEGTAFAIPRKYIWFGSRKKDGHAISLNLQFFYPDMTAQPSQYPDFAELKTNIGGTLDFDFPVTRPCIGVEGKEFCTSNYVTRSFVNSSSKVKEKRGMPGYNYLSAWTGKREPKDEHLFNEELQMMSVYNGSRALFYEGNYLFPDYWFTCRQYPIVKEGGKIKGICTSHVMILDKVAFNYSFPRHLYLKHREIRDAVRAKIQSFIIPIE
ncbi:MAG: hypothetical protein ACRBDL_08900 [Alphaproteobacteria bacterium]